MCNKEVTMVKSAILASLIASAAAFAPASNGRLDLVLVMERVFVVVGSWPVHYVTVDRPNGISCEKRLQREPKRC